MDFGPPFMHRELHNSQEFDYVRRQDPSISTPSSSSSTPSTRRRHHSTQDVDLNVWRTPSSPQGRSRAASGGHSNRFRSIVLKNLHQSKMQFGPPFMHQELSSPQLNSKQAQPFENQFYDDISFPPTPDSLDFESRPSSPLPYYDDSITSGVVLAYVDETNITISTQRHIGRPGAKVDFSKLLHLARKGRKVLVQKLFCSQDSSYSGVGG